MLSISVHPFIPPPLRTYPVLLFQHLTIGLVSLFLRYLFSFLFLYSALCGSLSTPPRPRRLMSPQHAERFCFKRPKPTRNPSPLRYTYGFFSETLSHPGQVTPAKTVKGVWKRTLTSFPCCSTLESLRHEDTHTRHFQRMSPAGVQHRPHSPNKCCDESQVLDPS